MTDTNVQLFFWNEAGPCVLELGLNDYIEVLG